MIFEPHVFILIAEDYHPDPTGRVVCGVFATFEDAHNYFEMGLSRTPDKTIIEEWEGVLRLGEYSL